MDVKSFRVTKEDWILVLAEERQEVSTGGIIIPVESGAEKVSHGAGRIVGVSGRGKVIEAESLKAGQRIAFRDYLKFAQPIAVFDVDEYWPSGNRKHYFMMSASDVEGLIDEDASVWVLNRPAMSSQPAEETFAVGKFTNGREA